MVLFFTFCVSVLNAYFTKFNIRLLRETFVEFCPRFSPSSTLVAHKFELNFKKSQTLGRASSLAL